MREMMPGNPVIVGPAVNIDCLVLMPGPKFPAQKHILDTLLRQDFFQVPELCVEGPSRTYNDHSGVKMGTLSGENKLFGEIYPEI